MANQILEMFKFPGVPDTFIIPKSIISSEIEVTSDNYATIITNLDDQPVNTIYSYAENLQSHVSNLPSNKAMTIINFAQKSTGGLGQVMLAIERNGSGDCLYFRTMGGSPASWSSWVKVANSADVEAVREALDNLDIETDKTLSIADKPADAKAAGDAINRIAEQSINLLPKTKKESIVNGVSIIYEDGKISITGTASSSGGRTNRLTDVFTLEPGTYTFWSDPITNIGGLYIETVSGNTIISGVNSKTNGTFTVDAQTDAYVGYNFSSGTNYNYTWNVQLEKGSQKTMYMEPSDITAVDETARKRIGDVGSEVESLSVNIDGLNASLDKIEKVVYISKNLLPISENIVDWKGIKSNYSDGIITFSGTAETAGGRDVGRVSFSLPKGNYILSLIVVSGTGMTLQLTNVTTNIYIGGFNYANALTFSVEEKSNFIIGFNAVANTTYSGTFIIQCESGSVKTAFEKPSATSALDTVARADIVSIRESLNQYGVSLTKTGNALSIASTFDGAELLLSAYVTQSDTDNPCFDFGAYSGSFVKSASDDICPVFYQGSYRCAGHGNNAVCQVTANGHGLTVGDIGKIFSIDSANWILVKIVNTNDLWFISDPVDTTRPFVTSLPESGTLTSGAVSVTYTAKTVVQLKPNNIKRTYEIYVDSVIIEDDGTYSGNCVKLAETYQSLDCVAMVQYLKDNVGNNTNNSYCDPNIGGELQYSVTYAFYPNGSCNVSESIIPLKDKVDVSNFGIVQAIKYADNAYVPFTTNFGDIATLPSSTVIFSPDTWADADFPPYKYYEINQTTGIGFALVFDISFGYGLPSIRKGLISNAGNFNGTSHKMYPNFIGKGTVVTEGQIIAGNAVRMPIKVVDNGIGFYWHSGASLIIEIEAFAATTVTVEIPEEYIGRTATIVKAANTIPLLDFVVTDTNIVVKTSGKGSATIKLT